MHEQSYLDFHGRRTITRQSQLDQTSLHRASDIIPFFCSSREEAKNTNYESDIDRLLLVPELEGEFLGSCVVRCEC